MELEKANELIAEVDRNRIAHIGGSVDIATDEYMFDAQKTWSQYDEEKETDVFSHKYWVCGNGIFEGIDTAEELAELLN